MTVLGLPIWRANLARIMADIERAADEGRLEAAEHMREAWVANIETEGLVDTGHYRDSVHVEREGDVVAVLTDVDYAGVLEFGDSRIPPHPVAERAFDEHVDSALGLIGDRVGEVVR